MNDEVVICLIFLGEFALDSQNKSLSLIENFRYCTKQFSFNSGHVGKLYKVLDDDADLVDGAVEDSDTSDDDIDEDEDDNDMSS